MPEDYYNIPLGQANTVQPGSALTLVTYGLGVHWAMEASKEFPEGTLEIIDLRTLLPWDKETVFASVRKTNKCLVLHEDTAVRGFGGELAAVIQEECFSELDAPVMRLGSMETPVPFNGKLEEQFFARKTLKQKLHQLLAF